MEKTGASTSAMPPMVFKTMKIEDIDAAFYNPRKEMKKGSKKYNNLKYSLEEFGYVEPLVVNDVNNRLISGHQRLNILRDNGEKKIKVSVVHIEDEVKEKALNVALNKVKGKWDNKKLADVLASIDDDYDLLNLGFEETDIEDFLKNNDDISIDAEHADEMDAGIKLPTTSSSVIAIAGFRFTVTADEFKAMEQNIIEAGYFSEKEISAELKRRFCDI